MSVRRCIVLGIDAAWTAGNPSGVALVRGQGARWECLAVAPSYASFIASQPINWRVRPEGGPADIDALIAASVRIAGAAPDVIAIDMPLSIHPITARRAADNAIASAYGARGLGAHSPSVARPGPIADAMCAGFAAHGYALATSATPVRTPRVMIEVSARSGDRPGRRELSGALQARADPPSTGLRGPRSLEGVRSSPDGRAYAGRLGRGSPVAPCGSRPAAHSAGQAL